jgi:hypothetical protein
MLYRYEFLEGADLDTVRDVELSDDVEALKEGYRTAYELILDGVLIGANRLDWELRIFDDKDALVGSFPFGHALSSQLP